MKNQKLSAILVLAAAMVLVSACAKVPQTELDAARAALTQAETSDATTYASAEWEAARTALTAAETEIETQNGKFALSRSYSTAQELLADATAKAETAASAAQVAKEEARLQSVEMLASAQATLSETGTLLADINACGRRPKGFALDVAALQGQLDGLNAEAPSIQQSIDSGDYAGAKSRAESISSRAGALNNDLQSAMTTLNCRPTRAA